MSEAKDAMVSARSRNALRSATPTPTATPEPTPTATKSHSWGAGYL